MLYSSYSGSPTLCDSTLFDGRKGLVSEYLPRERERERPETFEPMTLGGLLRHRSEYRLGVSISRSSLA